MATISHKDITDPQIHEPKGITGASAGQVYVANGTNSGSWEDRDTLPGGDVLVAGAEGQGPLTGGAGVVPKSLGTITTGTVTVNPGDRALQIYTNNGNHTLGELSAQGCCLVQITNGASAGTIDTSGWDVVVGDTFTTTNGHRFLVFMARFDNISWLNVTAAQ